MGVSTDALAVYGIQLPEGVELPWGHETKYEGDEQEWWRDANGFEPTHQPFTDDGEYAPGWSNSDPRFAEHFAERNAWDTANPMPVEVVRHCHHEHSMFIVAVPGYVHTAYRGSPVKLPLLEFPRSYERVDAIRDFIRKHVDPLNEGVESANGDCCWWLCSYWG